MKKVLILLLLLPSCTATEEVTSCMSYKPISYVHRSCTSIPRVGQHICVEELKTRYVCK